MKNVLATFGAVCCCGMLVALAVITARQFTTDLPTAAGIVFIGGILVVPICALFYVLIMGLKDE